MQAQTQAAPRKKTTRCAWCGKTGQQGRTLWPARRLLDTLRQQGKLEREGDYMHMRCGNGASRAHLELLSSTRQYDSTLNRKAGQ